jgi:hypothetical protein
VKGAVNEEDSAGIPEAGEQSPETGFKAPPKRLFITRTFCKMNKNKGNLVFEKRQTIGHDLAFIKNVDAFR